VSGINYRQIRRLSELLGIEPNVLASAVYRDGLAAIETFVDHHFDRLAAAEEVRLGDAWIARLGAGRSVRFEPSVTIVDRLFLASVGEFPRLSGERRLPNTAVFRSLVAARPTGL
jgi:hypothetical protein